MSNAASQDDEALTYVRVTTCLSRYCHALANSDWDALERDVVAEDATWEIVVESSGGSSEERIEGRSNIVDWFRARARQGKRGRVRISLGTHVVSVEGSVVHSTSHLSSINSDTLQNVATGVVYAEHVNTTAGWRIRRYRVVESIAATKMKPSGDT